MILILTGDQYYRLNTKRYEVERGYPKPIYQFFTCPMVQTQRNDHIQKSVEQQQQYYGEVNEQSFSPASSSSTAAKKTNKNGLLILPLMVMLMFNQFYNFLIL